MRPGGDQLQHRARCGPATGHDLLGNRQHIGRHLVRAGERARGCHRIGDLAGGRDPVGFQLGDGHAAPEQVADLPVRRARAGAAEREIADARRPGQRRGSHAQRLGEARELGVATHDQDGAGLLTGGDGLGVAGDHGDHALVGGAQLDARHVVALDQLERRAGEQGAEEGERRRTRAGQNGAGGLLAREVRRQQGAGEGGDVGRAALRHEVTQLRGRREGPARVEPAPRHQDGQPLRQAEPDLVQHPHEGRTGQGQDQRFGAAQGHFQRSADGGPLGKT